MSYLLAHPARVAALAFAHVMLVGAALAAAFLVAIPLALLALRSARLRTALLGSLGAIYTIPSLALLALLVEGFGLGIAPIFIALVAYAQFILVRALVTGLDGVDASVVDAARGMGFSERELLLRVRAPLALPVILGGVRVAAVAMIALATLGGYVGAGGLGSLIFTGLALHHPDMIVAGSATACALAVAADLLVRAFTARAREAR